MKKKLLAELLCLGLTASLFTGCGNSTQSSGSSSSESTSVSETSVSSESANGDSNVSTLESSSEEHAVETASSTSETSASSESTNGASISASEEAKDPDKLTYQQYTAEEIQADMYNDIEAAKQKYSDQYVEITGVLESAEVVDTSIPPAKIVYLKTTAESTDPNPNTYVQITAYAWDDEWLTLDDFNNSIADLQPGDPVILRGYIDAKPDYAFSSDGPYRQCTLDLISIQKSQG